MEPTIRSIPVDCEQINQRGRILTYAFPERVTFSVYWGPLSKVYYKGLLQKKSITKIITTSH